MTNGLTWKEAAVVAADYTAECIRLTYVSRETFKHIKRAVGDVPCETSPTALSLNLQ